MKRQDGPKPIKYRGFCQTASGVGGDLFARDFNFSKMVVTDGIDNDENGVTDELRDGGPGTLIEGQDNILAWVTTNYDLTKFEEFFGDVTKRPAYKAGYWWTGDEDMDWVAEFNDTGADGIFADTQNPLDAGEKDGIPTLGEPNFDKTL